jgi:hypothetical protein
MQVGTDRARHPAALEARLAVVPEPRDHASKRRGALVENRAAGVVLEAGQLMWLAQLELAAKQHVSDHAPRAPGLATGRSLVRSL